VTFKYWVIYIYYQIMSQLIFTIFHEMILLQCYLEFFFIHKSIKLTKVYYNAYI